MCEYSTPFLPTSEGDGGGGGAGHPVVNTSLLLAKLAGKKLAGMKKLEKDLHTSVFVGVAFSSISPIFLYDEPVSLTDAIVVLMLYLFH